MHWRDELHADKWGDLVYGIVVRFYEPFQPPMGRADV